MSIAAAKSISHNLAKTQIQTNTNTAKETFQNLFGVRSDKRRDDYDDMAYISDSFLKLYAIK